MTMAWIIDECCCLQGCRLHPVQLRQREGAHRPAEIRVSRKESQTQRFQRDASRWRILKESSRCQKRVTMWKMLVSAISNAWSSLTILTVHMNYWTMHLLRWLISVGTWATCHVSAPRTCWSTKTGRDVSSFETPPPKECTPYRYSRKCKAWIFVYLFVCLFVYLCVCMLNQNQPIRIHSNQNWWFSFERFSSDVQLRNGETELLILELTIWCQSTIKCEHFDGGNVIEWF